MTLVAGLVLLIVGATLAVVASAQYLALEPRRLPGAPSWWWSSLWFGHMEPEHFDPPVRDQVRQMRMLALVGGLGVCVGIVLLVAA